MTNRIQLKPQLNKVWLPLSWNILPHTKLAALTPPCLLGSAFFPLQSTYSSLSGLISRTYFEEIEKKNKWSKHITIRTARRSESVKEYPCTGYCNKVVTKFYSFQHSKNGPQALYSSDIVIPYKRGKLWSHSIFYNPIALMVAM